VNSPPDAVVTVQQRIIYRLRDIEAAVTFEITSDCEISMTGQFHGHHGGDISLQFSIYISTQKQ
jgi:hypothetical protein